MKTIEKIQEEICKTEREQIIITEMLERCTNRLAELKVELEVAKRKED